MAPGETGQQTPPGPDAAAAKQTPAEGLEARGGATGMPTAFHKDTGAYIFGCAGPKLLPGEAAFFRATHPLGFILFARNLENPNQIRRLTEALRACVGWEAPVLIDQEGGRVARMGAPHWSVWEAPLDAVARVKAARGMEAAVRGMYLRYQIIASELLAAGIDVNCAPCADIATSATHAVLRNRCYGETAAEVIAVTRAVAAAHLSLGVLPVLKHIPGHGRANLDSHLELPKVDACAQTLDREDFATFRAVCDLPLGMSAHIVFQGLGQTLPATFSPEMVARIRTDIGFDGLLMTDDISMQALSGTMAQRSRRALAAGCDVVLHCNGEMAQMQEIAAASGRLSPDAQTRCTRAFALRNARNFVDIPAAIAELETLR